MRRHRFAPWLALQMCGQSGLNDRDKRFPSLLSDVPRRNGGSQWTATGKGVPVDHQSAFNATLAVCDRRPMKPAFHGKLHRVLEKTRMSVTTSLSSSLCARRHNKHRPRGRSASVVLGHGFREKLKEIYSVLCRILECRHAVELYYLVGLTSISLR